MRTPFLSVSVRRLSPARLEKRALISCSTSLPSVRPNSTVTQLDSTASFEMLCVYVCVLMPRKTDRAELFFEQSLFFPLMKELVLSGSLTGFNL